MKCRILGFSRGNVNNPKAWSGTNYYFYKALRKYCDVVEIINALCTHRIFIRKFKFYRKILSHLNIMDERIKIWKEKIKQIKKPYDFILHLNVSPFLIHSVPFAIYMDLAILANDREISTWRYHGFPKEYIGATDWELVKLERSIYKAASIIFTFSRYIKNVLIKTYKIDPKKIISVGAGPNLDRLPEIDNKQYDGKTILFVGKMVYRKGGFVLMQAFKKVKEKIPEARLVMISSRLKKYTREKKVKEFERFGIFIKGFTDKKLLDRWYRKASVFVMPSLFEAFGIVFLEAMAYKLPCIGTSKCAMSEIIEDGKTGFLVPSHNSDELADKIIFILKNKKIAKKMGERGRKRIERYYTWDRVARRIVKEIEGFLSKKRRHCLSKKNFLCNP